MQMNQIDRGLESLSIFPKEPMIKKRQESDCRRTMESLFSSSPTSSPSLFFGDSIGMESSVDIAGEVAVAGERGIRSSRVARERRFSPEFPPPIPSLARTENLLSRMPWVLRRHYTGDGRLILTEEKASRYEYFRAHRANGRLTLHLVPLDSSAEESDDQKEEDEECCDEIEEEENDKVECLRYRSGSSRCVVGDLAVPAAIRPVHS